MPGELIDHKTEAEKLTPVQLTVEREDLSCYTFGTNPVQEKLGREVAEVIFKNLDNILYGDEVLLVEVRGFPGLKEIDTGESNEGLVSNRMKTSLPLAIVEILGKHAIIADLMLSQNQRLNPKATVIVRQYMDHDKSLDSSRGYYSRSVWQYYVRRVRPIEEKQTEVPVSPKQETLPEVPAESVLQKRRISERFAGIFTRISGYFLSKKK